jgi:Pyruvate/2-oxoacid:ferredoxin oxidoreductase delta subunit
MTLSRRDVLLRWLEPLRQQGQRRTQPAQATSERVAVIQGRFCLALTSFCSVCVERCPEPGAMKMERGMPTVVPEACIGCGICQDVCPAPRNAVLMMPARKKILSQ